MYTTLYEKQNELIAKEKNKNESIHVEFSP